MQARSIALVAGVVVGFAAAAWYLARDEQVAVPEVAQPIASATVPCETDARCVGSRHVVAAATACKPGIENLAGYRVRWAGDVAAAPLFARFAWRDRAAGTISFIGDQAEFEDASGSFHPVTYECDFDPAQGKLLDARVRQGRLP